MDIPIKLKASEKAAIDQINKIAPEIYQEKNPGFRWAASVVAKTNDIDWEQISKVRIEDIVSSEGYEDDDKTISHLTIDDQDFELIKQGMDKQLGMKRGVQKAFLVRAIIKWQLKQMNFQKRMLSYTKSLSDMKNSLSNSEALKLCVDLFCDDTTVELGADLKEMQEKVKKVLLDYYKRIDSKKKN
ncbi:MAG: hypothetical protein K6G84_09985 [Lachnospiraceae bacterium]|nr:hypothetical protein [Lachnospiraceae bacterium]